MSEVNYKKIFAIKNANENRIKKLYPNLLNISGIYIFHRIDENGFKKYYCGQAKNLITRIAAHLSEYDHIANSLRTHKLYGEKDTGWEIEYFYCDESELDKKEQLTIKHWHVDKGYIPYNKTGGSQGEGKFGIAENKPARGYYDGLKQGYKNASRDVAKWFEKHLQPSFQARFYEHEPGKNAQKAMDKFKEFLKGGNNENY